MQTRQGNMLESLRNVRDFLDEHADQLSGVVKTKTKRDLLVLISDLATHQSGQASSALAAKGSTQAARALRTALVEDHMSVISRLARVSLPDTPEVQPLKMPRGKPSAEKLASAAYGMATVAEAHANIFIGAGLPEDFAAQLTNAADALISARAERAASRGRRVRATTGLKSKLSAGRKIVAALDAMVRTALRNDPALMNNWKVLKRVAKVTGRTGPTAAPAPAPAPTPTPTPAPAKAA